MEKAAAKAISLCCSFFLYGRKNKPPALQGEESSLDKRNSCAKINVGLQTTNKKHRRSKGWT